ncbi:MAG: hypothetical protein HP492_11525 [Nitrospira sp.]|nr:hypothetical protein [Nitrospira sp.]MBH0205694.1 hypothetical protein [Nitrospira sp.]
MDTTQTPRILSHDERKAAEAAFAGRAFNPAWSESARKVYDGLMHALPTLPDETIPESDQVVEHANTTSETAPPIPVTEGIHLELAGKSEETPEVGSPAQTGQVSENRQQAIQAGILIDVTADAKKLGLTFPVTITKPLWEVGIAPLATMSEEDKSARVRDVLMAFRLRLAGQTTLSPLIDFPAMLAMPPGAVPQPVPLFALIQPDEENRAMATLLLPNEVAASIVPMN